MSHNKWVVEKYEEPWPHIVIDNFYDDYMWDYIIQNIVNNEKKYFSQWKERFRHGYEPDIPLRDKRSYRGLLYNDRMIQKGKRRSYEPHDDPILTDYFLTHVGEDFMKDNFKLHRSYSDSSVLYPYVACKYNHQQYGRHRIHDELLTKVQSCCSYISPEHNTGTIIFDTNKEFYKVITWKPNRALIFAPINNVTWHDFMQTEKSPERITLDYFLYRPTNEIDLPMISLE